MRTVFTTLENGKKNGLGRVTNRLLLYITDNMVTYHIFQRGTSKSTSLCTLFLRIKLLELDLKCHIQVIHVPGTTMIRQGTDGPSRGVEMQSLASHTSNGIIPLLWRAAPGTYSTLAWVLSTLPPLFPTSNSCIIQTDFSDWSRSPMISRPVLWYIFPSFAKQTILQALAS